MAPLFSTLRPGAHRALLSVEGLSLDGAALAAGARAARRLLEVQGVTTGDRVIVSIGAGRMASRGSGPAAEVAASLVGLLGAIDLGAVAVPISASLGEQSLAHLMQDAAPKALVAAHRPGRETALAALPWLGTDAILSGTRAPAPSAAFNRAADDAPCIMLYTSGTTGPPKGVPHSASAIAANLDALAAAWAWDDAVPVVHALPMHHVHGLVLGFFGGLRHGGGLVHLPRFSPAKLARTLEAHHGLLFAVPTMLHRLLRAGEAATPDGAKIVSGLGHAHRIISGSAPLPTRLHGALDALCGQPIFERYGLTETLIVTAVPVRAGADPGCVGPPIAGVEVRVVDDDGEELPRDGVAFGEVQVRGPSVMRAYHGEPGASVEAFSAGFFRTGDIAARRADGSLKIVGRASIDLIKSGGYRIGAGEVEAALLELEGVLEAAVVGVPDDALGQRLEAHLVAEPGQDLDPEWIISAIAERLSPEKRPRAVHLHRALPRNALGKVQKRALLRDSGGGMR